MPEVTAGGVISAVETSSCRFKLSCVDSGLPPQRGYLPSLLSPMQILVAAWAPLRFFYAGQKFSRSFSGESSHVEHGAKNKIIYISCLPSERNPEDNSLYWKNKRKYCTEHLESHLMLDKFFLGLYSDFERVKVLISNIYITCFWI